MLNVVDDTAECLSDTVYSRNSELEAQEDCVHIVTLVYPRGIQNTDMKHGTLDLLLPDTEAGLRSLHYIITRTHLNWHCVAIPATACW